jgi:hypothetical protein
MKTKAPQKMYGLTYDEFKQAEYNRNVASLADSFRDWVTKDLLMTLELAQHRMVTGRYDNDVYRGLQARIDAINWVLRERNHPRVVSK